MEGNGRGAHDDPDYAALLVRRALINALYELRKSPGQTLAEERYRKFRRMGEVESVKPDGTTRRSLYWELTRDEWVLRHRL